MTQAVENTKATLWEQYHDTYLNFVTSVSQIRILTFVNEAIFKDFPVNLPDELRDALFDALERFPSAVHEMVEAAKAEEECPLRLTESIDEATFPLVPWTTLPYLIRLMSGAQPPWNDTILPGFETLLRSQASIMAFALLDAFMADTLRTICKLVPEILRSEKKIDWTTALTFGSREELFR